MKQQLKWLKEDVKEFTPVILAMGAFVFAVVFVSVALLCLF